jgi:hypothetical protein
MATGLGLSAGVPVLVPEISDYEVRRELLRAGKSRGLTATCIRIDPYVSH